MFALIDAPGTYGSHATVHETYGTARSAAEALALRPRRAVMIYRPGSRVGERVPAGAAQQYTPLTAVLLAKW